MIRAALVLFGLVAGYVVVDVSLRVADFVLPYGSGPCMRRPNESRIRLSPHPFLPYVGVPSATFTAHPDPDRNVAVTSTFNSYGFRTHEFTWQRTPHDFIVVTLGGSTTFGEFAPGNQDTWPALLERRLAAALPDRNVVVYNLGTRGATSLYSAIAFATLGMHLQPDLVLAYHGENDVRAIRTPGFRPDQANLYKDFDGLSAFQGFRYALPDMWHAASAPLSATACHLDRALGLDGVLRHTQHLKPIRPWPIDDEGRRAISMTLENLATIHALAKAANARSLFATFKFFPDPDDPNERPEAYNEAARPFFERRHLDYVDLEQMVPTGSGEYNVDRCHFTARGREEIARHFFDAIAARGWLPGH